MSNPAWPFTLTNGYDADASQVMADLNYLFNLIATPAGTTVTLVASTVNLVAGQFVSFGANGLVLADNTDATKPADGFVIAPVLAAGVATVYLTGAVNSLLAGLTPGGYVYLSTAGGVTTVRPVTGALQILGRAPTTNSVVFNPGPSTQL
jgi:hypothetical protein